MNRNKVSPLKYRFPLPLVHSFIENINQDGKSFGIQVAMRNAISKSGSKLVVTGLTPKLNYVLKYKSVVIVANHPYGMDPIPLIGALPERSDLFLIINFRFLQLLPNLKKNLIPVFVNHQPATSRLQKPIDKVLNFFYPPQQYPGEKAHDKNIKAIKVAARKVKKGGLVILFVERNGSSWRSGVGHLLKEIGNTKDAFVVNTLIEGTSHFDYARLIPGIGKILPQLSVTFSSPYKISELLHNDPKVITSTLETKYHNWTKKMRNGTFHTI